MFLHAAAIIDPLAERAASRLDRHDQGQLHSFWTHASMRIYGWMDGWMDGCAHFNSGGVFQDAHARAEFRIRWRLEPSRRISNAPAAHAPCTGPTSAEYNQRVDPVIFILF